MMAVLFFGKYSRGYYVLGVVEEVLYG